MRKLFKFAAIAGSTLLIAAVLIVSGFRFAAFLRETADRDHLAPSTGRLVETRSGRVFVQDKGSRSGPAVVLIHGTAAWSQLWWRTTDALVASGYRVIALDLPPFGFSDRPGSYTRADQAARIDDVLAKLGVERTTIVGHSFGAGAAVEYVLRYPERTDGLVLVDAALGLMSPASETPAVLRAGWVRELLTSLTITNPLATKALLSSLIEKKEAANSENVAILQAPLALKRSTADVASWLTYFTGSDPDALSTKPAMIANISAPVAILWGDKDSVTPPDQAQDIRLLLPRASLTILSGLGHIPQIEDPVAFNSALVEVLQRLPVRP